MRVELGKGVTLEQKIIYVCHEILINKGSVINFKMNLLEPSYGYLMFTKCIVMHEVTTFLNPIYQKKKLMSKFKLYYEIL